MIYHIQVSIKVCSNNFIYVCRCHLTGQCHLTDQEYTIKYPFVATSSNYMQNKYLLYVWHTHDLNHTHPKLVPIIYYRDKTRVQPFYFFNINKFMVINDLIAYVENFTGCNTSYIYCVWRLIWNTDETVNLACTVLCSRDLAFTMAADVLIEVISLLVSLVAVMFRCRLVSCHHQHLNKLHVHTVWKSKDHL